MIVTDDCGGRGGKKFDLEKEKEEEEREGRRKRRKFENEAKGRLSGENRIAKKTMKSLHRLRLRDGLYQKFAGQRWWLCATIEISMVIPIQNVRSHGLKM